MMRMAQNHGLQELMCDDRSLWTRDIEEEILPTCRELGIKVRSHPANPPNCHQTTVVYICTDDSQTEGIMIMHGPYPLFR